MAGSRRLAAIMFTDIAGFTSLAQSDEPGALRLLQEQDKLFRPILAAHRGRKVKSTGDGLLIEFPNALDAVECGVELQLRVRERNAQGAAPQLRMRVGIHLGDVERQGTDILGDAVNIASRIQPLADPGGVCLTEHVFAQVHNKVTYPFESLGLKILKGVKDRIDVYRVVLPWAPDRTPTEPPSLPRLAVLPLANISPDPKDEYFADGLTEELISVISQARGLRVIARTSVNQYKGTTKSIAQIGSELGVSSVLEGSVRKAGGQLRITVQLIDVRTEEHRWAQTYDRTLDNVFAIQAEVAEQTAGALKVELLKSEREAIREKPTANLAAYEFYLRGMQESRRLESPREMVRADKEGERFFEAALREDPQFSAAYSHLATHLIAASGTTRPARTLFPRARELAARALELNPNSSDAHAAQGNLAMQADLNWARAEAEFQQAIALNPSSSFARGWYAYLLTILQRFDEAKKQLLVAIELDPLRLSQRLLLIDVIEGSGDYGTSITLCEKLLKDFGENLNTRNVLASAYAINGRADDAIQLVEPLKGATDTPSRGTRSRVLALLGRPEELRALIEDWERGQIIEYVLPVSLAKTYATLGNKEKAFALLEQDFREGDKFLWAHYQDVPFDAIREDPRFVAMLRAMNLPTTLARPLLMSGTHPPT